MDKEKSASQEIWSLGKELGLTSHLEDSEVERQIAHQVAVRNSEGRAGGIACVWNRDVFEASSKWDLPGAVVVNGIVKQGNIGCCIINVYAPARAGEKHRLWDAIGTIVVQNADMCVCVMGDFNVVRRREERAGNGETFNEAEARGFDDFICSNELEEIRIQGRKYTWFKPNGRCKSKLDRFLVNEEWLRVWEGSVACGLQRTLSDHLPIQLRTKCEDWGPTPFRFLNVWVSHPDFHDVVDDVWSKADVVGWKSFVVKEKLKMLKVKLKEWNKLTFGSIDHRIQSLKIEIQEMD
ncbi:uncharacterized protein LOC131010900 [Salvia miltiorrhiza]|uniref:uncharacterized protein LOC131010900 n=1 Tax=Salvia miltiorrhiza TaxID=226208 RepID=UPI0025AC87AC|nr:uncharacterized protein LOC131010900 [Salvia miltiorrhiza]